MRNFGLRIANRELDDNHSKSAIRNPHFEIEFTLRKSKRATTPTALTILVSLIIAASCKSVIERQDVRPRVLRDVPARNLAYRLTPDV